MTEEGRHSMRDRRRRGPMQWEQSYRLLDIIRQNPAITAEELQMEGATIGIEISIRTAFRFLQRYRVNKGDIFKCTQTHLQVVADILQKAPEGEHLTALDIQEQAVDRGVMLHLTTVYRILRRLVASGSVIQLEKGRQTHYEWRRGDSHHGHLTCTICGRTVEFYQEYLDGLAKRICNRFDFEYRSFEFILQACCRHCRAASDAELDVQEGNHGA